MPNRKLKRKFEKGDVVTMRYGHPRSGLSIGVVRDVTHVKDHNTVDLNVRRFLLIKWITGLIHSDHERNLMFDKELRLASDDEKVMYALAGMLN